MLAGRLNFKLLAFIAQETKHNGKMAYSYAKRSYKKADHIFHTSYWRVKNTYHVRSRHARTTYGPIKNR